MRYIADSDGYIMQISFGADISCNGVDCVEYTGAVPSPYSSLESWYQIALNNNELCYWRIVDGNLTWSYSADRERGDCPVAAPFGYNDKGHLLFASSDELDAYLVSLVASMDTHSAQNFSFMGTGNELKNGIPFNGNHWWVTVYKLHGSSYAVIETQTYGAVLEGYKARNIMSAGVLLGWEWYNPPLIPGVEYRTTKRYAQKPVYETLINLGLSAEGITVVDSQITATSVCGVAGTMGRFGNQFIYSSGAYSVWATAQVSSGKIRAQIHAGASAVGLNCTIHVSYTKE